METGRPGAMKLELSLAPCGPPWYDNTCDATCYQDLIAYGGNGTDIGWDAATDYTFVVSWAPGTMSFSRNGATLGTVSFDGTYAPQPLTVRFGSPRHGTYPGEAFMPHPIVFKDVLISGTPGTTPGRPPGRAPRWGRSKT